MVAWSSICAKSISKTCIIQSLFNTSKYNKKRAVLNYVSVRSSSSHHDTLYIRSSTYQYTKFKDMVLLYMMVGLIPIFLVVGYTNIFIGPAQLALIPEGYEPKHWEYYQHPITRFFAKYLVPSPKEMHERYMHNLFILNEKKMVRHLERKIKNIMSERGDYQAWYFTKPLTKYERLAKETEADLESGKLGLKWDSLR